MKRRVGKVVLFLLLGAILNIVVAWGLFYNVGTKPIAMLQKQPRSDDVARWNQRPWKDSSQGVGQSSVATGIGWRFEYLLGDLNGDLYD